MQQITYGQYLPNQGIYFWGARVRLRGQISAYAIPAVNSVIWYTPIFFIGCSLGRSRSSSRYNVCREVSELQVPLIEKRIYCLYYDIPGMYMLTCKWYICCDINIRGVLLSTITKLFKVQSVQILETVRTISKQKPTNAGII